MKIEKISDNQIRCTLNGEDLASRELKISELAYGTEKAKVLFHDMMQQASKDFGFEAENTPLMVEAIPVSSDCIILVITKVDNPEEIDAKFGGAAELDTQIEMPEDDAALNLGNILDACLKSAKDILKSKDDNFIPMSETIAAKNTKTEDSAKETSDARVVFSFPDFNSVCEASLVCHNPDFFKSSLYKRVSDGLYLLCISGQEVPGNDFTKLCNMLSEYGHKERDVFAASSYLSEHCKVVIREGALSILAQY